MSRAKNGAPQPIEFGFISGASSPAEPLTAELAVFKRPRTHADIPALGDSEYLPLLERLGQNASLGVRDVPGKLIPDESRLLVSTERGDKLFGIPTINGWICLFGFDYALRQSLYCSRALTEDGLEFSVERREADVWIGGMTADNVQSVDVELGGTVEPAELGENGFVYSGGHRSLRSLRALVVTYSDGSIRRIPLS